MKALPSLGSPTGGVDLTVDTLTHRVEGKHSMSPQEPEADMWKYTSRLWEDAQVKGVEAPKVSETCISNFPTKFRVTIRHRGVEASGEGRNKKTARHIAAKRVCQRLNIRLA